MLKSVRNNRELRVNAKKCLYDGVIVPINGIVRSRGMGYEVRWALM